MLEPRRPYTYEQLKVLYPVLTEVECRIVADIEQRYRFWEVWPHLDYRRLRSGTRAAPSPPCSR